MIKRFAIRLGRRKTVGMAPGMPLASRILALATASQVWPVPEIGQTISLLSTSECWSVSPGHLHRAIAGLRSTPDLGESAMSAFAAPGGDPLWVEYAMEAKRPARGVLACPDPVNAGRIAFSGWTMGSQQVPFWIPVISEWRHDVDHAPDGRPLTPVDRIFFRQTPGGMKMLKIAVDNGELSKDLKIEDLCGPMLDVVAHTIAVITEHGIHSKDRQS